MSWQPLLADESQIQIILRVCECRQAMLSRRDSQQTERYLLQVCQVKIERLGESIAEHIKRGRKIYKKCDAGGKLLTGKLQANVTLIEDLDIYVEMEIKGENLVILAAHSHYASNRLPQ